MVVVTTVMVVEWRNSIFDSDYKGGGGDYGRRNGTNGGSYRVQFLYYKVIFV